MWKNKDIKHDFTKDPIKLQVKENYLYADGTTLGADNGIAVAMGLALLASDDIKMPKLEIVFTANEEVSMEGAMNLDGSHFEGRYIINLDSEEERQNNCKLCRWGYSNSWYTKRIKRHNS